MGAGINVQDILNAKNEVLDKILNNLKSWDGEVLSGINLIESNQEHLDELKDLNEKLSIAGITSTYNEEYEYKLNLIMDEQRKLTQSLKVKQDDLKDNIQQLNKRDKVIDNYIKNKKEPIFINKEL